jgi:hypothetical protein
MTVKNISGFGQLFAITINVRKITASSRVLKNFTHFSSLLSDLRMAGKIAVSF